VLLEIHIYFFQASLPNAPVRLSGYIFDQFCQAVVKFLADHFQNIKGVEKPNGAGYTYLMTPPDSPVAVPEVELVDPSVTQRKPRSSKQFFLQTATRFGFGLAVLGLVGLAVWAARNQLATLTLESFLRSKEIPADITVENLQLGTAQIRHLKLGPTNRPSLVAQNTIIQWRVDSKASLFIIDKLQIEDVTLRVAVDANGKPDFGALAPFMKPSTGPKRSVINGVTLSNATLLIDTPSGLVTVGLKAWGGEAQGWTGRADVTPPSSMIAKTDNASIAAPFTPIRLGFAVRQSVPTSSDTAGATFIGFAALPKGQSLTYQGFQANNLTGDVKGLVSLGSNGRIRVDTRPITLGLGRLEGHGLNIAQLGLNLNPIFWTHENPWQSSGWGNLVATGTIGGLKFAGTGTPAQNLTMGPSNFRLGAARAQSGRMQADYVIDGQSVSGPIAGQRIRMAGNVTTTLTDITQIAAADLQGRSDISGAGIVLPSKLRGDLAKSLPPEFAAIATGRFSGLASIDFQKNQITTQVSLSGPLNVSNSTGAKMSWISNIGPKPTLLLGENGDGSIKVSAMGTGQLQLDLPALGNFAGFVDGATFGPAGWAFVGRDMTFRSAPSFDRQYGVSAAARLARININSPNSGMLNGNGAGQILVVGARGTAKSGRANLTFDGRATANSVVGTLAGPIEGFGQALGLGGYGVRGGTLSMSGNATRSGAAWQVAARGRLAANAFSSDKLGLLAPNLNVIADGTLALGQRVNAQVQIDGGARSAQPSGQGTALGFGGVGISGAANLSGTPGALVIAGNLASAVERGTVAGFAINRGAGAAQFAGNFGNGGLALRGTATTSLAQLTGMQGPVAGRVAISGARASGPFALSTTASSRATAFWDSQLSIARPAASATSGLYFSSDLKLATDRFLVGTTRLDAMRADLPISITTRQSGELTVQGRLRGQAGRAVISGTNFVDLQVSGPFSARTMDQAWQANGDISLAAASLTTGDTRLMGLTAQGPLSITSDRAGVIRVASTKCLAYNARSGRFPGEATVGNISGRLCPSDTGQLAILSGATPRLFATTQLDPLAIQMGGAGGDQRIELGEVNGRFAFKPNGNVALNLLATQFGLSLKMPDGTTAVIKANEAELDVTPRGNGISLKGRIGRVSSLGLPVLLSGGANADMASGPKGLAGTFSFDDIILKDIEKSPRFGEVRLVGSGTLDGNDVAIQSDVLEPASEIRMATLTMVHDIATGAGRLAMDADDLLMSPVPVRGRAGLDIVTLVPPLRGVVLDMVGVLSATADIAWDGDQPVVSSAKIATKGLDFETLLGPVTALAGDVALDDLLLVRTAGTQTIKIGELNTGGIPVQNGTIQFTLPGTNSLQLESASWPFAEGKLSVRPATWTFRDGDQSFAIDVEDVDLAKLLRLTEVPNLEIDGKVSGVFPIEVRNGDVEIVGGRLKAREGGGVIRYTAPNQSPPPPPPGFFSRIRERLFGKPAPSGADLAMEALRALEYNILEITVDGRISGELLMGVILEGANQQVLSGQPFKFNIKMNVPVGQLLENLNRFNNAGSSPEVLQELDRVMREEAAQRAKPPPSLPAPAPTPIPVP
jgi:Dicarboxylate transport